MTDADGRRGHAALDWLVRTWLPTWLDLDGSARTATAALTRLPPVTDPTTVRAADAAVATAQELIEILNRRDRANAHVNGLGSDRSPEQEVALEGLSAALWYLFPDAYVSIDPPPPPPRPGEDWSSGQDDAWAVAVPTRDNLRRSTVAQIAERRVQMILLHPALNAARTAAQAFDDAWAATDDRSIAHVTAHVAARDAVRPRRRDPSVWGVEQRTPAPQSRGFRRFREDRRRRSAPPEDRAAAVFDAVLDVLHEVVGPTLSQLRRSAVEPPGTMGRPR